MMLRATSLDATRADHRIDSAGSVEPTRLRRLVTRAPSAALAGLAPLKDRAHGALRGAIQVYSVRGVPPATPGDGSEFSKALEAAVDKKLDVLLEGVDSGLSPEEADVQSDKALGKTDPTSNFEALDNAVVRIRSLMRPRTAFA
ncbi:hypothetical protein LJR230_005171 [Trinickia sp. LjRoot230]|uniref:hypothetical protein n=1 Tax=Trinickia sp. LjRoot230 TaxID=3342288 RepID=UPI003ECEE5D8